MKMKDGDSPAKKKQKSKSLISTHISSHFTVLNFIKSVTRLFGNAVNNHMCRLIKRFAMWNDDVAQALNYGAEKGIWTEGRNLLWERLQTD